MHCKNCRTQLHEQDDYCSNCGGKIIRNRLTIKNLFKHLSETFFNYDNKFLKTFIQLFKHPEDVIVGYINGVRKRYVNVFSYFALAITLSGLQIYIMQKFQTDITIYDTTTEIGKSQQEAFETTYKLMNDYQSLVMMLYIPFYALIARLVFLGIKTFNYTELIVVFLYTQAQISICIAIITLIALPLKIMSVQILGLITIPIMFIYFGYCLKRVYQLNLTQMLLRTLIFLGVFAVFFIGLSILTAIYMYFNGSVDHMIDAKNSGIKETTEIVKDTIN